MVVSGVGLGKNFFLGQNLLATIGEKDYDYSLP